MKDQQKYEQAFRDSFIKGLNDQNELLTQSEREELQNLVVAHMDTLTAIRTGYFAVEDLIQISSMAGEKLALQYRNPETKSLNLAWQKVAEDFHNHQYWGFKTQSEKPKLEKKKDEMKSFFWTVFQAAIVMKFIVLYFGIKAAELDSQWHYIGLGIAIFVSFTSLMWFAWRKSKTYKD